MEINDITIGLVGSGGDGVVAAGDILLTSASFEGLNGMLIKSFGPQIRGGESSCRVRISGSKIYTPGSGLDVLVCFSWPDYKKFTGELDVKNSVYIIVDELDATPAEEIPVEGAKSKQIIKVPFEKIAKEVQNSKAKNIVTLGVLTELFKLPRDGVFHSIKKRFEGKEKGIIDANLKAFEAGEEFVKTNLKDVGIKFKFKKQKPKYLLTGNEAVAFGALAAGCKFYSSYPITPASEIMEWLSVELPRFGGTVVQAEDEISAICMVTGAAYGGAKAMTATSGPGLSLKSEAIGLGTMAELPYVIVDVQRGGPSTGLPTKSEQGDLMQAIYGMHGDAPHAVLAASDVEDCFRSTIEAFNVAEAYQMPVVLLTDQFLGHRKETVDEIKFEGVKLTLRLKPREPVDGEYKRFLDTPNGVSPMSVPGLKGGEYLCSGIEHDEWGAPSSVHGMHEKMCAKRQKKLEKLEDEFGFIRRYGTKFPTVGIITWGSNKGVARAAVNYFMEKGESVGALIPQLLYPLQKGIFKSFLTLAEAVVIIENTYGGQFYHYLRGFVDLPKKVFHLKSSGARCFTTEEVICEVEKALK